MRRSRLRFIHRQNVVMRVVESRPHKIVHRRIDNDEALVFALLEVDDRGDQNAGVADDGPARLQHHLAVERRSVAGDDLGVIFREGRRSVVGPVGNRQAPAEIDMLDCVPVGPQRAHEVGEQGERVIERLKIGDLRADMHVDAANAQARQAASVRVNVAGARDRHAELVLRFAGRDLGVGQRVDIGIDPDGDRRNRAAACRRARQRLEFRLQFDVEAEDVLIEPEVHLVQRLADPGKDDALAGYARRPRPPQFPFADDVHASAELRQRRQHRLIRIGLHRIEDKRVLPGEGVAERLEMLLDRRARIAIEGRSYGFGDGRQRDALGVKVAVAIGEGRHGVDGLFQQEIEEKRLIRRFNRRDGRFAQ